MRKLTAQQQEAESDLDLFQELVDSLDDSQKDLQYLVQDIQRTNQQIDQKVQQQEAFPLPDADEMKIAASTKLKFSPANRGGLHKVQRSASKGKASKPSFASWEVEEGKGKK